MTVREMLSRMDSDELSEWLAFDAEYSLPDHYTTTGQVCATTAAAMSGAKVTPADFVPFFRSHRRKQSPAEMRAFMAGLRGERV